MKKNKILKVIAVFGMIILFMMNFSFAISIIPPKVGPDIPGDKVPNISSAIIGTMKWIGYAIAVGMILYVGIKYVMAAADEKASLKGLLVKVIIGILIIAASTLIVNAVLNVANS